MDIYLKSPIFASNMDLQLSNQLFIVGGATSGFGHAVAKALYAEGAQVIAIARGAEKLHQLAISYSRIETLAGDLSQPEMLERLMHKIGNRQVHGALINAGGPPAGSFQDTGMEAWDQAYQVVLRWKVALTQALLPRMKENKYGRLVYIESSSVKQPIPNLVLSNSLRMAVVGFVKTLSQEVASHGITTNIVGPGYHATPAMDRLFDKMSQQLGIPREEAKQRFEAEIKTGKMGNPDDLASLVLWLLSKRAGYVTGQTWTVDGGLVQSSL